MTRRMCPSCGRDLNAQPHAPGCVQLLRQDQDMASNGCAALALGVAAVALAAVALTVTGSWGELPGWLHQLAHGIAPGIIH